MILFFEPTRFVRSVSCVFWVVCLSAANISFVPETFSLFLWSLDQEYWEISSMEFRFGWISNLARHEVHDFYVLL